jgi:tRNA(Ile)-lysidine synthetase-like protein
MTPRSAVRAWLETTRSERIVVAVSGGADSVALATAVAAVLRERGMPVGERVVLAHFNHRVRPAAEHANDLRTVLALGARIGAPVLAGEAASTPSRADARRAGGAEAVARRMRYDFLIDACRATGATLVCTAHTADDQVETVLMRLLGSVEGPLLAGIPRARAVAEGIEVHRPLLDVGRAEIEACLEAEGLAWSEDRTNESREHRRNVVRHDVLPLLASVWPAVRHDLLMLGRAMGAERARVVDEGRRCPVSVDGGEATIERARFFSLGRDARLEVLYSTLRRTGLLDRRDRPGHRFFAPLLGADPGGTRTVLAARGVRIGVRDAEVVIGRDVVRPD